MSLKVVAYGAFVGNGKRRAYDYRTNNVSCIWARLDWYYGLRESHA